MKVIMELRKFVCLGPIALERFKYNELCSALNVTCEWSSF
jgi:hypothetical protein